MKEASDSNFEFAKTDVKEENHDISGEFHHQREGGSEGNSRF
jgi:hypothetical protein